MLKPNRFVNKIRDERQGKKDKKEVKRLVKVEEEVKKVEIKDEETAGVKVRLVSTK